MKTCDPSARQVEAGDYVGRRPLEFFDANQELIHELQAMGVTGVTTRKLERWRQAHAAPAIEQISVGRGGTVTRWPPGAARQIAALVDLLNRNVPLRECPLALFYRGFPIDPAVVRAGFREMYRGFADVIGDDGDPLDRSDAMARNLARRPSRASMSRQWEKRLRRDRETDLEDVLSAGFTGVIAGEEPTLPGVAALLRAAALDEPVPAELPPDLRRYLGPTAEDTIPPSQRAEVQSRMVGWLQAHPEVIAALGPHFGEA
ncbi:hypothetical protein ACIA5C_39620 [Actinoplanes sp. NPDC051343]|uniref:hypothetical protein n=1 Tax=Actinoplanes sp. NPDC051343 TaxID=3363906 RepID=UPI0037B00981